MENNTIKATSNPKLANQILQDILDEGPAEVESAELTPPFENVVTLPAGLVLDGQVITTAEVRELTGRDEEAILKASNVGRALTTILSRGVVRLGELPAEEALLDKLFVGDRDMLLLGIYKATFGSTAELTGYNIETGDAVPVEVDLLKDIPVKKMVDPINEKVFTVKGPKNEFVVTLPTGATQKELFASADKSISELTTILLYNCILEINGKNVFSIEQIRNLGLKDRQLVNEEITNRTPGPQFNDFKLSDPENGGEVVVPISIGTLFRL